MAKYELPIYGENDEVVKMHETNICPWAVYIQAADMQEQLKDKHLECDSRLVVISIEHASTIPKV